MSETTNAGRRPEKPFRGLPRRTKPLHPALDAPPAPAKDAAGMPLDRIVFAERKFPKLVKLGEFRNSRAMVVDTELEDWMKERMDQRNPTD